MFACTGTGGDESSDPGAAESDELEVSDDFIPDAGALPDVPEDTLDLDASASLVLDPNGTTPLAAELSVSFTGDATVEVFVEGEADWYLTREGSAEVVLPVLGFKPEEEYSVTVAVTTDSGSEVLEPLSVETGPLPSDFPVMELLRSKPARMAPGHTLLNVQQMADYLLVVDSVGEVLWYHPTIGMSGDARILPNGNILLMEGGVITELTFLGEVVRRLSVVEPSDVEYHHAVTPTGDGNLLSLVQRIGPVDNFRTDYFDPTLRDTVEVTGDGIVELDAEGNVLHRTLLREILDFDRLGYDSLASHARLETSNDWVHSNAVIPADDGQSIIASSRHQDAVYKLTRDTHELVWLLANHHGWGEDWQPYLLTPAGAADGEEFQWPYHQHAPELTASGSLLVFDNGNYRASPGDGKTPLAWEETYSRAVEYRIDEDAMTVEQVWQYVYPDARLYSVAVGDADLQEQSNNVLLVYGGLLGVDAVTSADMGRGYFQARVIEIDRDAEDEVVFELDVHSTDPDGPGWIVYRAERIDPIR